MVNSGGGGPEWSPDETYLNKLERLAFALVRTKPQSCEPSRNNSNPSRTGHGSSVWREKVRGLAGPYALTLLVVIPYIAENSSGPIITASLLLAGLSSGLAVWAYTDFEGGHGHCAGDLYTCLFATAGEFPAFLGGWWMVGALSASLAGGARALGSILDSVTGRHIETLLENTIGSLSPFGAPVDVVSLAVIGVPTVMCSMGMEDSAFLRKGLLALTSSTTLALFTYALTVTNTTSGATEGISGGSASSTPVSSEGNLCAKIFSGAALSCVGFLGLYTISRPDNVTLTQHKHFAVSKRLSASGLVVLSASFLIYFVEAVVVNRVQVGGPSVWTGDPPLVWPLEEGVWKLVVAWMAVTALCLSTFEFLVPLCQSVTKLANDGLLYRKLRRSGPYWNPTTPLVFGCVTAAQGMLVDTKVLLGLVACCLLCIHILVTAVMIAMRYQVTPACAHKRSGHTQTRPKPRSRRQSSQQEHHSRTRVTRPLLTVTILKSGRGRGKNKATEVDICGITTSVNPTPTHSQHQHHQTADTACLINHGEVPSTPEQGARRRESTSDFSFGSNVSGYESDDVDRDNLSDPNNGSGHDTDIDAVVTEYQEAVRVATLNGAIPMTPSRETGRRVALAISALIPCLLAMASSINRNPPGQLSGIMLGMSSALLAFLLLVVVSRQPQRKRHKQEVISSSSVPPTEQPQPPEAVVVDFSPVFIDYSVIPWVPAGAIFLHCCLLVQALDLSGSPFAFWLGIGLIIYFGYSVTKSVAAPTFVFPQTNSRRNSSVVTTGSSSSGRRRSVNVSMASTSSPIRVRRTSLISIAMNDVATTSILSPNSCSPASTPATTTTTTTVLGGGTLILDDYDDESHLAPGPSSSGGSPPPPPPPLVPSSPHSSSSASLLQSDLLV